jgi:hypothetical protein
MTRNEGGAVRLLLSVAVAVWLLLDGGGVVVVDVVNVVAESRGDERPGLSFDMDGGEVICD